MADSKLRDLSADFAVKVIKMCDGIASLRASIQCSALMIYRNKLRMIYKAMP